MSTRHHVNDGLFSLKGITSPRPASRWMGLFFSVSHNAVACDLVAAKRAAGEPCLNYAAEAFIATVARVLHIACPLRPVGIDSRD
jgi:hypothetical protein